MKDFVVRSQQEHKLFSLFRVFAIWHPVHHFSEVTERSVLCPPIQNQTQTLTSSLFTLSSWNSVFPLSPWSSFLDLLWLFLVWLPSSPWVSSQCSAGSTSLFNPPFMLMEHHDCPTCLGSQPLELILAVLFALLPNIQFLRLSASFWVVFLRLDFLSHVHFLSPWSRTSSTRQWQRLPVDQPPLHSMV